MSHILGTTGSSTVTTTAVQHQPSTAIITEEVTTRATSGKATSLGSGGDQQAPVISLQQREFYDHSLAVGLAGGSVSTATTIASHLQPSTEWSAPAPGHSTVGIGIGNSGEGGGGKLAPTLSTIPAFGEAQPTRATSTMLSASLYSQDAAVAVSRNWSGVTTAAPDTIPSSLGGGVNFGQTDAAVCYPQNDSVGGQQHQQQPPPQQQQQQQQWFGGPGASLDPSQATATASRNPLSNMPFPSPNQHIPQPALFQAPQPHLPGASSGNGSNGATNPTVSYQYGLLPPSGQFSYIGGGGNPSGFTAGAAFGAGAIGLPTLAPQQQPPPYGVTPNIPMFAPASGFGGGLGVRGAADGGGGFILSAGTNGNVGTNSGFGSGGGAGGIIDSKPVGSQPLVEGQPAQLQLSAPMFTVSAPLQSVFMVPNGAVSGFPGAQQPRAMVHPATAAATTAAAFTVGAVVPSVPLPVNAFLQLNPLYPGLKQLLQSPPVYMVDDFFTSAECDALMSLANNYMIISPVVGAGAGEISESRTSSSCFLAREDLPTVCSKVMALTGKPLEHLELPQVGRYYTTQKYANHWDAFDLNTEDGRRFAQNGGQRVCTVLVYLNDVTSGGCTSFPRLGFRVQPKKGTAVVFFPATLDGTLDPMLLHAAEPAIDTKWVSQIWIRQGDYHGTSTARIPRI